MNVVVTGSAGFIGRHLVDALRRQGVGTIEEVNRNTTAADLAHALDRADVVFHVAGINRPKDPAEFQLGNADFTASVCGRLADAGRKPLLVFASSRQAQEDNPYGRSKRAAEEAIEGWVGAGHGRAVVFRLKNVFGKWCRPNYNSVTATFCYNVAHELPLQISDEKKELELIYIDDVVAAMIGCLAGPIAGFQVEEVGPVYRVTLGKLAALIRGFRASRRTLELSSFDDEFVRRLYATYLSYLDGADFAYRLDQKVDPRGSLAEFMKSAPFGQIFVSRTKPGITRGNHFHHTKTEKFLVVEGDAIVRFRRIGTPEVIEHRVLGTEFKVIDIPPGYLHSIENVGSGELVTLFWACEIFDPQRPDCMFENVLPSSSQPSPRPQA